MPQGNAVVRAPEPTTPVRESVTHMWVKPLTPLEETMVEFIVERYEGVDGSELRPEETEALVVLHVPDIRLKRSVFSRATS
jgi:hypothetical protein